MCIRAYGTTSVTGSVPLFVSVSVLVSVDCSVRAARRSEYGARVWNGGHTRDESNELGVSPCCETSPCCLCGSFHLLTPPPLPYRRGIQRNKPLNSRHSVGRCEVGISTRHLHGLVTHQFLDGPQINPQHYQPAGEGMPAMPNAA
jgi:hypothetical protein